MTIVDCGFAAYRRSLDARRAKPAGAAACSRSLDAIRAGLGLPPEVPGLVCAFAMRETAVGPFNGGRD